MCDIMHTFDDNPDACTGKSRSRKKRESAAAQKIGESLAALPESALQRLNLPAELFAAIGDWKKFPGHEAKRRQMQFIGRVMRDMDLEELQGKLDALLAPGLSEKELFHRVETYRDMLLRLEDAELDAELGRFASEYAKAPVAKVKHLILAARIEKRKKSPPKAYRELFRLLKALIGSRNAEESPPG